MIGCGAGQGEFVGDRRAHLQRGVAPLAVVLVDPRRYPGAGLGLGGEVFERAQLELQGRVPRFDDRVVPCRQLLPIPTVVSGLFG